MRDIILYIATSLDGYIARLDESVEWLFMDGDYGYEAFYASIDTVLLGRKTYAQILGFGDYPYPDKQNYVFTRSSDLPQAEGVEFVAADLASFVRDLKTQPGRNIWLVGGAEIVAELMKHDLVDEFVISVHPIVLGDGIPLFLTGLETVELEFVSVKTYESGLVQLTYRRGKST